MVDAAHQDRPPSFGQSVRRGAQQALIGTAAIAVLVVAGFIALLAWGGLRIVPADRGLRSPDHASAVATTRIAGPANGVRLPPGVLLAIPVAGVARRAVQDSWGDPRDNGLRAHHGTDIMAPRGTLVTAAGPGVVEKLWNSAAGGITLYVRSPQRRVVYYYAHLAGYAPGVREGMLVRRGDALGYVGDTGNAGAGNFHLHFGVSLTRPEQAWHEGVDIDPYPLLAGKPSPR